MPLSLDALQRMVLALQSNAAGNEVVDAIDQALALARARGIGVPAGGTTGQVLTKVSNVDFAVQWATEAAGAVDSVNGQTGTVVLTTSDIAEGTNPYFTDLRAQTASVENAINSGTINKAPSEDSVFNALAGKQNSLGYTAENVANKGVANGYASLDASALIPITQIPPAALERLVIVADQAARYALTITTVQNGDTVKQNDIDQMFFVIDDTNLGNASGYTVYTAGAASSVPYSGVTGVPTASGSQDGILSQTDWNTFNNKVSATRAINTTSPLTGGANLSADVTLAINLATGSADGYLSSADWNTFNNKAPTASPAFTGIPTAPTAGVGTSTTQIATTAFVLSQGFTGATGSMPFAHQSSTSVVTNATSTYSTAISTTITVTATSAPVYAKATATFTVTGTVPTVLKYRISINAVAGQEQLLSLTAVTTNYTAAVQYVSAALGPGVYNVLFEIARNSGTGTVSFFEGTLDAIALQGASSNGITSISGLGLSVGPGSGAQSLTGTLSLAGGGTNASLAASNGGIVYSTASAFAVLAGTATAGQMLRSGASTVPSWSTATFPSTTTINQILYSSANNVVAGIASTVTGALVASSTGVPSFAVGTTANRVLRTNGTTAIFAQVALATDVSGTLPAANGGTGHGNWANQQIPFGNGTSLVGDPQLIYDSTNIRLNVGGSGTFRINAIVASGSAGALQAYSEGTNNCLQLRNNNAYAMVVYTANNAAAAGSLLGFGRSRGTQSARTQSLNGDTVLNLTGSGYTGTQDTGDTAGFNNSITFVQTEDATATANGGEMFFNTTPNGTRTPVERVRIKQSGETVFAAAIATARMDTATKNALSAVGGWVVFDTDLNQLSYYNGTTWINL